MISINQYLLLGLEFRFPSVLLEASQNEQTLGQVQYKSALVVRCALGHSIENLVAVVTEVLGLELVVVYLASETKTLGESLFRRLLVSLSLEFVFTIIS
jgi:hypothetical protein